MYWVNIKCASLLDSHLKKIIIYSTKYEFKTKTYVLRNHMKLTQRSHEQAQSAQGLIVTKFQIIYHRLKNNVKKNPCRNLSLIHKY